MQMGGIEEPSFLDKFICGLKPKTRTEVELHDPQTLTDAVRLADRYDTIVYQQSHLASPPRSSPQEDTRGEPMQLDALQAAVDDMANPVQIDALRTKARTSKLGKLTDEERAHLRSINACFKCRKTGHMARECPTKDSPGNSNRQ